jgi:hypothetical protein
MSKLPVATAAAAVVNVAEASTRGDASPMHQLSPLGGSKPWQSNEDLMICQAAAAACCFIIFIFKLLGQ